MLKRRPFLAQYHGSHLTTQSCVDAIVRLLAFPTRLEQAHLLSHERRHAFYLLADPTEAEPIFVRSGFTSDYPGEGPAGLSAALLLLLRHGVEIEEIDVPSLLLDRVDTGLLTRDDAKLLDEAPRVRPIRIYDYIQSGVGGRGKGADLIRGYYRLSIPWALLDHRLLDLARQMEHDPASAVLLGFRRLEAVVKQRCGLGEELYGVRVFANAFRGTGALLHWRGISDSEADGRAQLFEGAYRSIRNAHAHREIDDIERAFREFHLLNELFRLESEAVPVGGHPGPQ